MDEIDLEYFQLMEGTFMDVPKPAFDLISAKCETLDTRVCLDNGLACSNTKYPCEETLLSSWYRGFVDAIELSGQNTIASKALIESVVSEWRRLAK